MGNNSPTASPRPAPKSATTTAGDVSSVLVAPPAVPDLPPGLVASVATPTAPTSPPPSRAVSNPDDRVTIIAVKGAEPSDSALLQAELALRNVPRFVPLEKSGLYASEQLNAAALLEACRIYQCHMRVTSQVFCTNQTHLRNRMRRCNDATSKNLSMLNAHFAAVRKFEGQMQSVELLEKQVLQMKKTIVDVVRIASRLNNLLSAAERLPTVVLLDRPLVPPPQPVPPPSEVAASD